MNLDIWERVKQIIATATRIKTIRKESFIVKIRDLCFTRASLSSVKKTLYCPNLVKGMASKSPGTRVKIALVGTYNVGKTTLVDRYVKNRFDQDIESTIGGVFATKNVIVPSGEIASLHIWDTAGSEKFKSLIPAYLRGAHVVFVCYPRGHGDLGEIKNQLRIVREYCSLGRILFVETKSDLVRSTSPSSSASDIIEFASANEYKIYKTSALTGDGVAELFQHAAIVGLVLKKSEIADEPDFQIKPEDIPRPSILSSVTNSAGECCSVL